MTPNLQGLDRSNMARLVLERRDGPRGRGFVYAAETFDATPLVIDSSTTFYPEADLAAADRALEELIVRLQCKGWHTQGRAPYTIIGMHFRRD
jgi:hypothetical protein